MVKICVIIASHISIATRVKPLIDALLSIIEQTEKVHTFLSISFENSLLKEVFNRAVKKFLIYNHPVFIRYEEQKTSQFRHIEKTINVIYMKFDYVLFLDDDDTYHHERVEMFKQNLEIGQEMIKHEKDIILAGLYEKKEEDKNHSNEVYEYWTYGVKMDIILNFFNIIKNEQLDEFIDNKYCDMLFSHYLRRLDKRHAFLTVILKEIMYNHNIRDDSLCGKIRLGNIKQKERKIKKETNFKVFIEDFNNHLKDNKKTIVDQMFLKYCGKPQSLINMLADMNGESIYTYFSYLNSELINEFQIELNKIKKLCNILYMYKHENENDKIDKSY